MNDKKPYAAILGLTPPWGIEKVGLRLAQDEVHIWVSLQEKEHWVCPECHQRAPITRMPSTCADQGSPGAYLAPSGCMPIPNPHDRSTSPACGPSLS